MRLLRSVKHNLYTRRDNICRHVTRECVRFVEKKKNTDFHSAVLNHLKYAKGGGRKKQLVPIVQTHIGTVLKLLQVHVTDRRVRRRNAQKLLKHNNNLNYQIKCETQPTTASYNRKLYYNRPLLTRYSKYLTLYYKKNEQGKSVRYAGKITLRAPVFKICFPNESARAA